MAFAAIARLFIGGRIAGAGFPRGSVLERVAALDDLVELSAVEPDAAALGAIVDFDALPVGQQQPDLAHWAEHAGIPGRGLDGGKIGHVSTPELG
jgi:hypothetical protein